MMYSMEDKQFENIYCTNGLKLDVIQSLYGNMLRQRASSFYLSVGLPVYFRVYHQRAVQTDVYVPVNPRLQFFSVVFSLLDVLSGEL